MIQIVQANKKRQKPQTSLKNVMFISPKTVSTDITPAVNQKRNRLYHIFAKKVAFLIYILFSEFFC